jgi:subtilisin family serine protease
MRSERPFAVGIATSVRSACLAAIAALLTFITVAAEAQVAGPPNNPNRPDIAPPITVIPRTVGNEPNATSLLPNTRQMLDQQHRNTILDDNFLTEDWSKGRNRDSVRTAKGQRIKRPSGSGGSGDNNIAARPLAPSMPREILIVVDGQPTTARVEALERRHRLARIESQSFPLIAATVIRWRIPDRRSFDAVMNELATERDVRFTQPNFRYFAQDAGTRVQSEGDPGQYGVTKLRLPEAHQLTRGKDVAIAVIDSGIDVTHPELAGAIIGTYDALNSAEGPHPHGTGVAGTIAAHARLIGSAPSASLIAIRAFGASQSNGAESTSFVVTKALNYAAQQNAQIINMSFAGPRDPLVQQALAAGSARGIVLIAAAGNAGSNSPPLYPAADNHVIAVTATDNADHLFAAANRGAQIAIAAPGVDILMPAPEGKYQVNSGTSFAAAYISGLAALLIDRNPGITPDGIRNALTATARDLGAKGRDDQFGAGLADALAAVELVSHSMTAGGTKPETVPAPRAPAR